MVYVMKYETLTEKKNRLDGLRPLSDVLVSNLDDWFRVELTYTSNAIEGNTLTRSETALVVEKGLTVGGKSLVEHLEAINHVHALDWVKGWVRRKPGSLTEKDILHTHGLILKGIDDENAGRYRTKAVWISGSSVVLPPPRGVPSLMKEFADWLRNTKDIHPVDLAAEAHYRLVSIHPFIDGNGRTARLLMNMILLMTNYPPAIIRKRDRLAYMNSLEKSQLGGSKGGYLKIIGKAVDRSLDIYLKATSGESVFTGDEGRYLKIGELAKRGMESNSTIRYWTKEGLLEVAEITKAGYRLYAPDMVQRIEQIHALKEQRRKLKEIKEKISRELS